jgi:hypothetical protein
LVVTWPDSLFRDTNCNATERDRNLGLERGWQTICGFSRAEKQNKIKKTKWIWASPWP